MIPVISSMTLLFNNVEKKRISKFLKQLHAQVLEKMLEEEMDAHLGYEKNSVSGNNSGNSRNGKYPKKIQTKHGKSVISVPP